jgi:hypothetical protein
MKTYTVLLKRRKGSPISYISGVVPPTSKQNYTAVEKEDLYVGDKVVPVPIVKGSHFRGRLRQFLAEKVLEAKAEFIEGLPEKKKQKIFKTVTLCYFVGNIQENENAGSFEVVGELVKADAFFKYFGYMVANLPSYRSLMSMGFAVPAIEGVTIEKSLAETFNLAHVKPSSIEVHRVEIVGGVSVYVPVPLVDVETYRVSGKLEKIEKLGSLLNADTAEVKEIIKSYTSGKGKEKEKEDMQNILFAEVIAPSCDLVQKITFLDDEEELHRGILTAYMMLFEREPFVGGRVSAGYGLIDEVIVLDEGGNRVEKDENALKKFIDSIDLERITELISPAKKGGK